MKQNPLDEINSSLVLAILMGVLILVIPLMFSVVRDVAGDSPAPGMVFTLENLALVCSYLLIAGLLWLASLKFREELTGLLLNVPDPVQRREYLWLGVGMVIASLGFTYLMFYPLSLVAPELVERWLLQSPNLLYWDENGNYWLGNFAGIVLAVILAPIVEELIFRGYLLNRWTLKMGALPAMLLSSSLFAILHPDMLGAFVFAVMMSLLYMKTQSLVAPILVHMSNNLLAVVLAWLDHSFLSGFEAATVSHFHEYLWLGILGMVIGFPWLWWYARRNFFPVQAILMAHERGDGERFLG